MPIAARCREFIDFERGVAYFAPPIPRLLPRPRLRLRPRLTLGYNAYSILSDNIYDLRK